MNHLAMTFQDDDKVSSFICTIGNSKYRLLPNDINMTRNYGEDHKVYKDSHIGEKGQQRTSKPSWRPNTSQVRVQLGIQEQSILDWTPRPHTESDFDDSYMVGKIISCGFHWHQSCFKIPSETTGIVKTNGPSESAWVLRHLLSGHGPCNFAWDSGPSCCVPPPVGARTKGALGRPPPWPPPLGCIRLSSRHLRRSGFA